MKNKLFVINTLLFSLVLISAIAIFNYKFDNFGFFQKNNGILHSAKAIASKNNVAGLENYDEREFQKLVIENFLEYPETIVLGSSRAMMIKSSMIDPSKFLFNHSVSGASLEDYIAITGIYDNKNILPKKIILGIDPWVFNQNSGASGWKTLSDEYIQMMSKISKKEYLRVPRNKNKYLQLINFENTKNNVSHLYEPVTMRIVKSENIDAVIKRGDGSIIYPFKVRFQKDDITRKNAKEYVSKELYCLENFKQLSKIKDFEAFIFYLMRKGVHIEFVLFPYHPIVYDYIETNRDYSNVLNAEKYLIDFAKRNSLKLYGSYNPYKLQVSSQAFTDGMHGKEAIAEKILTDCFTD